MQFTKEDIDRTFDFGTLARGQAYAREGRVLDVRHDGAGMIEGVVRGSAGKRYRQAIRVDMEKRGFVFDGNCSCPMDYNCKHVVAVLLACMSQEKPASTALPARAEAWMQELVQAGQLMQARTRPLQGAGYCLAYVLVPDALSAAAQLYVCKARVRKDGSIGSVTTHNEIFSLLAYPPDHVRPEDEEPLRLIAGLGSGSIYREAPTPAGRLGASLLRQLCAEGRLLWGDALADLRRGKLALVRPGPSRGAALGWHPDAPGSTALQLRWRFDDGMAPEAVLPSEPPCYVHGGLLGELALPQPLAALQPAVLLKLLKQAPRLQAEQRSGMALRLAELGLDRLLPPPQALQTRERKDIAPSPCLRLDSELHMVRGNAQWYDYAVLSFDYDGIVPEDGDERVLRRVADGAVELIARDLDAEAAASARLGELGFEPPPPDSLLGACRVLCLPDEAAWLRFARHGLPRLQSAGWRIEIEGNYRYELTEVEDWYADVAEEGEAANAWFSLELGIVVDGRRHALLPLLLELIRKAPVDFGATALSARDDAGEIIVDLPGDARVALPWERVKPIFAIVGELYFSERGGDTLRLRVADAARLAELEKAAQLRWIGGERLRELGRKLHDFDGIREVPPPQGLQARLREYQQAGLSWMQFLREYGFGGILADDMGLGKTVQTLAHILAEKEAGRLDRPALVVAPTSLMGNWQAEAARFAPGLRVLLLHGKDRAVLFDRMGEADLVLTTYALLGRDEEALRRQRYHLLILDESQYIKNQRSRAAQVVCLLEARHRLCLTGTPLQNHLGELWSQFHFLMPGLLGDEKDFRRRFRKPIEQQGNSACKEVLTRRVKPFMLRRTKDRVATELPPKTEIVLSVELGSPQADLYETVRVAMDRKVREEIGRKGLARSQIVILDALLKLRQVCCDPRLLRPAGQAGSAKLDTLLDLLETLLSEGRKVLVFSQFTSMLSLIEDELRARAIGHVLLTGDTLDRAAPVAAFQQGQASVFLISLKAGGVGLNLTAADTVIHYDPWWNPASENQATDRAWRIGQEQPVFVYKLIARGTLEEKIQELQRRKGDLANAVLEAEAGLAPAIGAEDLQAIFAPPSA